MPQGYDGSAATCRGFLLQLDLFLATVHPVPSDREKSFTLISCLTGRALQWASAVCGGDDAALDHYEEFNRRFRAVFDHPPEGRAMVLKVTRLFWPKSRCFDYLYQDADLLLRNYPVQATICLYEDSSSDDDEDDSDDDEEEDSVKELN
ncbi:protein ripply3-like [Salmo trutta]|uniref:protein ripply3-like n=1 Tax=Salmo trutta TaxID=8032 RepID=UPI001132325F|nr:protein ripply3-like [Salmo trutta]